MVDTIKFSQMTNAGDINNNDIVPSLRGGENVILDVPWIFLPPGTTAQRPAPSSTINYRLRFNTDDQLYEYYDATLGAWTQLQESAFTVGPFITYTADASLPDAQNLGALSNGILKQTITSGSATLGIAVNGTDYYGPGFIGYLVAPAGIADIDNNPILNTTSVGASAVNYLKISNNITNNGPTISAEGLDANIALTIASKGTGPIGLVTGALTQPLFIYSGTLSQHLTRFNMADTSADRSITFQDASGTLAFTSDLTGFVTSVSGTTNRITSTGGTAPIIDISASYVGQASITTLGTITTGIWNGTAITNANLANSSVTVNGTSISLGASGTVTAAAGTLTGTTLNSTVVSSSLTSVGTITTGVWTGTSIAIANGGTGLTSFGTGVATALGQNVTGSGGIVLATSPTLVTPTIGAALATSINFGGSTLNTYADSTFTPTMTCGSPGNLSVVYANQTGIYVRIGSMVYANIRIQFTPTFTTATGQVQIAGLPFPVQVGNGVGWSGSVSFFAGSPTWPVGTTSISAQAESGASFCSLPCLGSAVAGSSLQMSGLTTGVQYHLVFSVAYHT